MGLHPVSIELGEVILEDQNISAEKEELAAQLAGFGFELLDDKKSQIIIKIKAAIVELVHNDDNDTHTNLSNYLVRQLQLDYSSMSKLFSEVEGITIEKYYIAQKIEKVKELLTYDELTLSEIAHRLNYSSTQYLSSQFKRVTGLSPTRFKQLKDNARKPLDEV